MTKSVVITARIAPSLAKKIAAYAKAAKRSKSQVIEQIVERNIDYEMGFVEAVNEGIRSADEEGTIPHEDVMKRLKEKSARYRKAMRKRAA